MFCIPVNSRSRARRLALALSVLGCTAAWPQTAPVTAMRLDSLEPQALKQWVEQNESTLVNAPAANTRVEVEVGNLDARLRLAPCKRIEPYMPAGARLWGRSRIGIRCLEGPSRWDVSIPLTVRVWGRGWVVNTAIAEGTPLTAAVLGEAEIDLAADNNPAIMEAGQWSGQVAARQLMPGQVLRASAVRPAQLFAAGAQVRVTMEGKGFSVTAEGQAMAPGLQGRPVRIRLESGRILSGTPVDERSVVAAI